MKMKKPRVARTVLLVCFAAVFVTSSALYISGRVREKREAQAFEDLRSLIIWSSPSGRPAPGVQQEAPTDQETGEYLSPYRDIYALNQDFFGWVKIEGTAIDYPVMHTPGEPEHYLHTAFDGSYSVGGVPFLDGECYEDCGNYIVYGHHMQNGTMFQALTNYQSRDFWEEHPTVIFDTMSGPGEYQIVAAFYARLYGESEENVFRYYNYTVLDTPELFEEYMAGVRRSALYSTGVTAAYGDQLLTLTTCSYHTSDGRFVIVAKKIS